MDRPDAIGPQHPFPRGSAASTLVGVLEHGLNGGGWRFEHDDVSWTAIREETYVEHNEQSVRVEDGARYGQGPVVTAHDGDFQYQLRCPADVTPHGLHRLVQALVIVGVLPNGWYFP